MEATLHSFANMGKGPRQVIMGCPPLLCHSHEQEAIGGGFRLSPIKYSVPLQSGIKAYLQHDKRRIIFFYYLCSYRIYRVETSSNISLRIGDTLDNLTHMGPDYIELIRMLKTSFLNKNKY